MKLGMWVLLVEEVRIVVFFWRFVIDEVVIVVLLWCFVWFLIELVI